MILKLITKAHLIDNVWTFRFESNKPLIWTAGQYMHVNLPHEPADKEGTERWFTIASAPYEQVAQITTRITGSTFKQALHSLPIGSTALEFLDGPEGDFIWTDSTLPVLFIAGGIGITPFHSILKQRLHNHELLNVTLIYSNRSDQIPFKKEIEGWTEIDRTLKVHYVTGEPLTVKRLMALEPTLNSSLVYLSGPEPMVESLGSALKAAGLPEAQFKHDAFPNYTQNNY